MYHWSAEWSTSCSPSDMSWAWKAAPQLKPLLHASRYLPAHDVFTRPSPCVSTTSEKSLGWEGLLARFIAQWILCNRPPQNPQVLWNKSVYIRSIWTVDIVEPDYAWCMSSLHLIFGRPSVGPKYTLNTFIRPTPHLMLYRVGELEGHKSFLCVLPLEEEVKSARAKRSIREKRNWSYQKWIQSEWNILTTASRDGHSHTYVHAIAILTRVLRKGWSCFAFFHTLLGQRPNVRCSQQSFGDFQYDQTLKSRFAVWSISQTVKVTVKISWPQSLRKRGRETVLLYICGRIWEKGPYRAKHDFFFCFSTCHHCKVIRAPGFPLGL